MVFRELYFYRFNDKASYISAVNCLKREYEKEYFPFSTYDCNDSELTIKTRFYILQEKERGQSWAIERLKETRTKAEKTPLICEKYGGIIESTNNSYGRDTRYENGRDIVESWKLGL
jgi:hypothetical protein